MKRQELEIEKAIDTLATELIEERSVAERRALKAEAALAERESRRCETCRLAERHTKGVDPYMICTATRRVITAVSYCDAWQAKEAQP